VTVKEPTFTMGVEEEYLLVDKETRGLAIDPPKSLLAECEKVLGGQVTTELLRSQIEVGTKVCKNIQEVREDLGKLRRTIIGVADRHRSVAGPSRSTPGKIATIRSLPRCRVPPGGCSFAACTCTSGSTTMHCVTVLGGSRHGTQELSTDHF